MGQECQRLLSEIASLRERGEGRYTWFSVKFMTVLSCRHQRDLPSGGEEGAMHAEGLVTMNRQGTLLGAICDIAPRVSRNLLCRYFD